MRQDLAKLMVERPRGGERIRIHRAKHNQKSAWLDGDAPLRGSMSRSRGTKWQSENFAPLIRILRSKRGVRLCPKATKRMKVPAAKSASKLARMN